MTLLQWLRYQLAWHWWALKGPYRMGDPLLGKGILRDQNRKVLRDRWNEREPKP